MGFELGLVVIGIASSIAYSALGIFAARFPANKESWSESDKVLGWTFFWCFEHEKYTEEGKKLCRIGLIPLVAGIGSWVAYFFLMR